MGNIKKVKIMTPSFIAIDFETANKSHLSACAVGLVRVEKGQIVAKERRLIKQETYFLKEFTDDIHGLTERHVKDSPLFDEVWQELTPMLKDTDFMVAHNASFDKSVLHKSCARYSIEPPPQTFTCSIKAAKSFLKLPSYKLNQVCDHLDIELNHHEALSDAVACARIMIMAFEQGYEV